MGESESQGMHVGALLHNAKPCKHASSAKPECPQLRVILQKRAHDALPNQMTWLGFIQHG